MPDYKVTVEGSDPIPVRANDRRGAMAAAVRKRVTVEPLSIDDAMAFGAKGVAILVAGAEDEPPAADDSQQQSGGEAQE